MTISTLCVPSLARLRRLIGATGYKTIPGGGVAHFPPSAQGARNPKSRPEGGLKARDDFRAAVRTVAGDRRSPAQAGLRAALAKTRGVTLRIHRSHER